MSTKKTFFWHLLLLVTCFLKAESNELESLINAQLISGDVTSLTRSILTTSVINKSGLVIVPRTWPYLIEIKSSNVVLDLAGNQVRGGILIDENLQNITIQNGIIDSSPTTTAVGIHVKTGTQQVRLTNLKIRSAQQGILFEGVHDSSIKLCDISQTGTAVDLTDSYNITLNNTYAYSSGQIGFSLLRSFTCVLEDCNALSTGEANTNITENNVFGFVSNNGGGNIFERCIANSTQALSTTDSQSLVAGFALRGSESCSKIIECESANAQTDEAGVTVPYGIVLEAQLDSLISITEQSETQATTISWSPDGKYLAAADDNNRITVYEFDRVLGALTFIANQPDSINSPLSVAWSPDGNYLAVANLGNQISIYEFDRISGTLTFVTNQPDIVNGPTSVSWSPDGNYLAATMIDGDTITVYAFDRVSGMLTFVTSQPNTIDGPNAVSWSPDGNYLAAAIFFDAEVVVYKFDRAAGSLISLPMGSQPYVGVLSVDWSPDGNYLAAVGFSDQISVYNFDRGAGTLTFVTDQLETLQDPYFVDWSSDGKYLAVAINSGDAIVVYEFDRGAGTLTFVTNQPNLDGPYAVSWSPDGGYLAAAIYLGSEVAVYGALTFPSENVIINNTVYCNSGSRFPSGVGISGSSIANLIIGNTAYSNPIPQGANAPIVGSNYVFCTNVFNPLFGIGPQLTQNISVDADTPICMPPDFDLLLKQTKFKACSFVDEFDATISLLELLASNDLCNATAVIASPITNEGYYCLANDIVSGGLAINASNVVLDLNGHKVTGGISFSNRDQVTILNGTVENASGNGISVTASSNITIKDVIAKNSIIGVNLDSVTTGLVRNCSFTQNVTGISLSTSDNLIIDSCIAQSNSNAGFDLISSTTNIIKNSKAVSTGKNNIQTTNQTIIGFIATNGNANVFERCVANGTQGLQVTDSDSLVAGFALRGSEMCTKIIDSESANALTNASGATIPYGIIVQDVGQNSPQSNLIIQNTVYCNSNDINGVGIFGNNVANLIIQNTVYCNPINLQIGSNVDELVSLIDNPTALTNIAIPCNYAIPTPIDINLILEEALSIADTLVATQCGPMPIMSGTTITENGNYCLSSDVTGDISITTTCVVLNLNNKCLTGEISVATAEDIIIHNGTVKPAAPTSSPNAAITIAATVLRAQILNTVIFCDDTSMAGIAGRNGISIAGHNVVVENCAITSGSGGDNTGASAAGNAGNGIIIAADAEQTIFKNCIIQTGNGGDTGSGTAGDGGNGILVQNGASSAEIINCTIMSTGVGGNSSGTNGDGGHGIYIESGAVDIAMHNCTVSNTGLGGSGAATLGLPGKAVFDLVTTSLNLSQIFKNFAHNIANPTKFDIQAPTIAGGSEDGILSPNPPDGTVLNPFANIYT